MTCGEEDLVDDLILVQKTYADSLLQLNILTPSEVSLILFGPSLENRIKGRSLEFCNR